MILKIAWGSLDRYINTNYYVLTGSVLHLMNNSLISKIHFTQQVFNAFVFQNYCFAEVAYLLIRLHKTHSFLGNIEKIDRNGVKDQNTHLDT